MSRRKVLLVMLAATVIIVAFLAFSVQSSANVNTKDLLLVHIVMRHGARTPVDTYPNDPYINKTLYPVGWGQLTNEGKLDLYNTGKFLRERYGKFLGSLYSHKQYYVQSTDVDRTKASLQLVNAGLWPPEPAQKWGPLDWQPIPVHSQPLDEDTLLLVRKSCPGYSYELEKIFNSTEIQDKLKKLEDLMKYLEEHTGKKIRNFDDIQDIYSTLLAEQKFNLTLPEWTKGYFPEQMKEPTAFHFKLINYNTKMIRLKGGVLLKKIIGDWQAKLDQKLVPEDRKAFLYGGHDSTIANLLSALNVFDPQLPAFGATILLEFSRDRITNTHGVEIFFRNNTNPVPYQLTIPGCSEFCPLTKLVELTEENISQNWSKDCIADDPNYVPPPLKGP